MKASRKSIHAGLYRMTYNSDLPPNLCPYFWKLIFAIIFFIPNFIIQIPSYIENIFEKDDIRDAGEHRTIGFILYVGVIFWIHFFYCTYQMVRAIMNYYDYDSKSANIGLAYYTLIALIGVGFLIYKLWEWAGDETEEIEKEKHQSIVIEFIKAKYNKYCPKIDWD